jgi:hypothetical protein
MPYNKAPKDHTEFAGGDGLVDPVVRSDRVLSADDQRMEIMFTNPTDPDADPATVPLGVPIPKRAWPDSATAEGTS